MFVSYREDNNGIICDAKNALNHDGYNGVNCSDNSDVISDDNSDVFFKTHVVCDDTVKPPLLCETIISIMMITVMFVMITTVLCIITDDVINAGHVSFYFVENNNAFAR